MKPVKEFKFKKGDIVNCKAFVFTKYEGDVLPNSIFPYITVIHTPIQNRNVQRKVLVRDEHGGYKHPFLVVGIKQIQTGYYESGIGPSGSGYNGYDEGEPATFIPDKYHDVYVLESMNGQRWHKLDFAIEDDLSRYTGE